jgi:hypothetical protein
MHDQEQIGIATLNSARRFKRAMDVVEAVSMTAAEKLTILKAWEADERALQRAEDEGMGGGEHAHLHRVQDALARLRQEQDRSRFAETADRLGCRSHIHS